MRVCIPAGLGCHLVHHAALEMHASRPSASGMAVFDNCTVLFELKNLSYKEKGSVKSLVTENGGKLCFVVNKQCSFVVVSDVAHLSTNRLRSIQKYQTPVVGVDYVHTCVKSGVLLLIEDYKLDASSPSPPSLPPTLPVRPFHHQAPAAGGAFAEPSLDERPPPEKKRDILGRFRIYDERDKDLPAYPDDFSVAKYSIFQKNGGSACWVLELQSAKGGTGRRYRVVRYRKEDAGADEAAQRDALVFPPTSEEAVAVYRTLTESLLASGLKPRTDMPPRAKDLGSAPLRQLLLEEKLSAGVLSHDVGVFVELLWTEALGCLGNILLVPVNTLSLHDVSRAEGLLIEAQRNLKEGKRSESLQLLAEFYILLPHRVPTKTADTRLFSQKLDLCQLIRDILNVSEMTMRSPAPSSVGKFRALRCSIEAVDPGGPESRTVASLLRDSSVQIHQVLRVGRAVELQTFQVQLGNVKSLLHSSSASNFVGILSRGLLLPCVGVEHHGIDRTDAGSLGSGIYFSDSMSTCLKYSKPSATDGSRLLVVCDVALGDCLELHRKDPALTRAPEGHDSVRAVRRTASVHSEFEDDEYVVYRPEQVQLRYVVRFSVDGDRLEEFRPTVDTSAETRPLPSVSEVLAPNVGIESMRNPLGDLTAGLLGSSGQQLPLQAVHVKCKLVDLLSQVVVFQKYSNHSPAPIEAKYVFPLEDSAAVCAFEAFIDGKHVVAQVKEKEQARREYRQAVQEGHGAYLMDQDAPDVFTISVGNLPAGATVLIKVTFVSELIVKDGAVLFSLPGSVAPWRGSAALNQTTQVTVDKVCVTHESASSRDFSLDMSIEMPNEISSLSCITHRVKMKRTDCKAVVSVLPGQVMGPDGFQLSLTLSEVHLPRMWVEKHPDKDSQACMLVFYPNFDVRPSSRSDEVVILLDTSESMRGEPLRWSRVIALHIIRTLQPSFKVNIVLFNSDYTQAFLTASPLHEAGQEAEKFLQDVLPVGGSTELWRPLRALGLLPPSRGIRNLILLSDGHLQDADVALRLLRDNVQHSRLFACGVSPTANQHMLRALAQAGGGAYEYFDTKTKHKWAEKVACQLRRLASPGCRSVSVKWHQFGSSAPTPVQAPKQLHALFNDCHTLVYGFVPHCTQATLLGELGGQELRTMVSTSELQKTSGTFLHKLTARAVIRDYEDGSLDSNLAQHEGKKAQLKAFIVGLSKEYSILSQFTSFVAVEKREPGQADEAFTDIPALLAEEDVDFLPYISWTPRESSTEEEETDDDDSWSGSDSSLGEPSPWYQPTSPASSLSSPEMSPVDELGARKRMQKAVIEKAAASDELMAKESSKMEEVEEHMESSKMEEVEEHMESSKMEEVEEHMESSKMEEEDESEMGFGLFDDVPAFVEALCSRGRTKPGRFTGSFAAAPRPSPPPPPGATQPDVEPFPPSLDVPRIQHGGSLEASRPRLRGTQRDNSLQFDITPKSRPTHPSHDAPPPPPPPPGDTDPNGKNLLEDLGSPVPPPLLPLQHQTLRRVRPNRDVKAKEAGVQHQWDPPGMEAQVKLQQQPGGGAEETIERFDGFPVRQTSTRMSSPPVVGTLFGSKAPSGPCQGSGYSGRAPITCGPPAGLSQLLQSQVRSTAPGFSLASQTLAPDFSLASQTSAPDFSLASQTSTTGFSFGSKTRAPGFSLASQTRAPGFSLASQTSAPGYSLAPGFSLASQTRAAGFSLASQTSAPGFSLANQTLTPGFSLANQTLTPGFSLASQTSAPGFSLANQTLTPGFSLASQTSAPGFSLANQTLAPGFSLASQTSALGFSFSSQTSAPGFSFGSQTSTPGFSLASQTRGPGFSFGSQTSAPGFSLASQTSTPGFSLASQTRGPGFSLASQTSAPGFSFGSQTASNLAPILGRRAVGSAPPDPAPRPVGRVLRQTSWSAGGQNLAKWTKIFEMQTSDGYWELTTELGQCVNVDLHVLADDFLTSKGIRSLGVKAAADILRLLATLVVLQMMRLEKLPEGRLLRTLFALEEPPISRPPRWQRVRTAVDWVCWADRQYPCVCSRLEMGLTWESVTRQLLGYDVPPAFSPLAGLKLRSNMAAACPPVVVQ
uniref:protein mono-ADP-ribosyltransferase PARP4 isoform X2 n=1 Tax=Doryrhamphus excisus TaxID=161450 RepID=UPI0025AE74CF|nr:protein mono-ADP-ribosyltransferase PARP4 isoform X2 [Doryrhamphus excisus]